MRVHLLALAAVLCFLAGCTIPRTIQDLEPPTNQGRLENLEQHQDYSDPDDGRPDYLREGQK